MNNKLLINNQVYFLLKDNRLVPMGKQGVEVSLNTPVSHCLQLLLNKQGQVVNQKEFFEDIWESKGQIVTANALYQNISLLRRALKSAGIDDNIIETVSKVGFRFLGTATQVEELPVVEALTDTFTDETPTQRVLPVYPPATDDCAEKTNAVFDKVRSSSRIKSRTTITIIVIALMLFTYLSFTLYENIRNTRGYFSEYQQIGQIKQCQIFARKSAVLGLQDNYLQFIKEKNLPCETQKTIYISINKQRNRISAIVCDNNITQPKSCITHIYLEHKNEMLP